MTKVSARVVKETCNLATDKFLNRSSNMLDFFNSSDSVVNAKIQEPNYQADLRMTAISDQLIFVELKKESPERTVLEEGTFLNTANYMGRLSKAEKFWFYFDVGKASVVGEYLSPEQQDRATQLTSTYLRPDQDSPLQRSQTRQTQQQVNVVRYNEGIHTLKLTAEGRLVILGETARAFRRRRRGAGGRDAQLEQTDSRLPK